jgi:triosephosphate isomerase
MAKYIVIGNWKMNPSTAAEAKKLFSGTSKLVGKLKKTKVVLAVPFIYISLFKPRGKKLFLGAQDVFWQEKGAHTGEVSAEDLQNLGVSHVIVGHSERRAMGENDDIVSRKLKAVLRFRMTPVLCIGEHTHDSHGAYLSFLNHQIRASLFGVSRADISKVIIAYEPIWAIGKTAKEAMNSRVLHETVLYIQKILSEMYGRAIGKKVKIIYGGSVEEGNAEDLIKNGNVSGFLPGHASLSTKTFGPILKAVDNA